MKAGFMMDRTEGGFTLLELLIAAVIASVILMSVVSLIIRTGDAYKTIQQDTGANFSLRQTLNEVSDLVRQSSTSMVVITNGTHHDSIDLQVPVSQAASTVQWGARGQAGWHAIVLVEEGTLLIRFVNGGGVKQTTDRTLAHNVDNLFEGEKGFSIAENDGLYVISVRVTAQQKGRTWRRSETTSVSVRN